MDAVDQGVTALRLIEQVNLALPLVTPWLVALVGLGGASGLVLVVVRRMRGGF